MKEPPQGGFFITRNRMIRFTGPTHPPGAGDGLKLKFNA
jgi:hypothetical protein